MHNLASQNHNICIATFPISLNFLIIKVTIALVTHHKAEFHEKSKRRPCICAVCGMAGEEPNAGEQGRPIKEVAKIKALVNQHLAYTPTTVFRL